VLVLGVSADKDVPGIAAALAPVVDTTIATAYAQPRSLAPDALAGVVLAAGARDVRAAPDVAAALPIARGLAGPTGSVIVAGSLFLVGEARALLVGAKVDPIAVSDPSTIKIG
jgi:dihydrofolate synthase/folylpolyglutamate synthase